MRFLSLSQLGEPSGGSDFLDIANDLYDLGIGLEVTLECFAQAA
jgi:hypothetical protein